MGVPDLTGDVVERFCSWCTILQVYKTYLYYIKIQAQIVDMPFNVSSCRKVREI